MEYFDFSFKKDLEDQLEKCIVIGRESDVDVTNTCANQQEANRYQRLFIKI
jgi:hypothetical protein